MLIKDDVIFGLSMAEVEERIRQGKVNITPNRKTKTYREIIFKNVFSVFNLVIFLMAILTIPTIKSIADIGNCVFIVIAFANLLIGIIQEVKAKKTVDSLVLLNEPKVKVLRDLEIKEINVSEIVIDETMFLEAGKTIACDSKVIRGECFVNESNLTGEADDILKKKGDELYSGSFVVSGECYADVIHIGKDNYIEQLSAKVTEYSKPHSEIMKSLNVIITTISFVILPIAVLLFVIYSHNPEYINGTTTIFGLDRTLVLALVTSINAMIPYGLFLLTSVSLAASVIKLARNKTLVQDLYCIESLARIDTLCLDKTGTLTDGTMRVEDLLILNNNYSTIEIISSINHVLKGTNQTSLALNKKYGSQKVYEPMASLDFNSTNKYSAVTFKRIGTFALGAPDVMIKRTKNNAALKIVDERAAKGNRVLALCHTQSKIKNNTLEGPFECIALITIHDNLRVGVEDTLQRFTKAGVKIKIISGDNPITISAIAKDAGVPNYLNYISLDGMSDKEVEKASTKYTIFGRVKPNQKKIIIQTLKKAKHKVAMTGDGINDILALKEADCSIAMASGSDAVKTVAQIVLLDSNFLSLPKVVDEGRRVINNIQKTSALYLCKTILMMLINLTTIICYFLKVEFTSPFKEPSQLILIEIFIIGVPSLIFALEENYNPIKGGFVNNIFKASFPTAFIVFINVFFIQLVGRFLVLPSGVETNISMIIATLAFYMVLILISIPFSKLRLITDIVSLVFILLTPLFSLFTSEVYGFDFFHFSFDPTTRNFLMNKEGAIMMAIFLSIDAVLYTIFILINMKKKVPTKKGKNVAIPPIEEKVPLKKENSVIVSPIKEKAPEKSGVKNEELPSSKKVNNHPKEVKKSLGNRGKK